MEPAYLESQRRSQPRYFDSFVAHSLADLTRQRRRDEEDDEEEPDPKRPRAEPTPLEAMAALPVVFKWPFKRDGYRSSMGRTIQWMSSYAEGGMQLIRSRGEQLQSVIVALSNSHAYTQDETILLKSLLFNFVLQPISERQRNPGRVQMTLEHNDRVQQAFQLVVSSGYFVYQNDRPLIAYMSESATAIRNRIVDILVGHNCPGSPRAIHAFVNTYASPYLCYVPLKKQVEEMVRLYFH